MSWGTVTRATVPAPQKLLAAQPELLAHSLDPVNAILDTVVGQVRLQTFRAIGLPGKPALRFGLRLLPFRITDWDWPGFLLIEVSR